MLKDKESAMFIMSYLTNQYSNYFKNQYIIKITR